MRLCRWKTRYGALVWILAAQLLCAEPVSLTLTVEDTSDNPVAGASVQRSGDDLVGRTDAQGRLTFQCELPCRVRVEAEGFVGGSFTLTSSATVHLERASASEQVSVTADRALPQELDCRVTTSLLAENAFATATVVTLDQGARPGRIDL